MAQKRKTPKSRNAKAASSLKNKKKSATPTPQDAPKDPPKGKVPTSSQIPLLNSVDVRREMAKLYREARGGALDATRAAKLVWMLGEMRRTIEVEDLERQIAELRAAAVAQGLIPK